MGDEAISPPAPRLLCGACPEREILRHRLRMTKSRSSERSEEEGLAMAGGKKGFLFSDQAWIMKLIVGLGNPGARYVNNRHNVGFRCVDFFARKQNISLRQRKARSQSGAGEVGGTKVVLAKPRTFMNLSGEAVAALMRRHRLPTQDLLIIYDDLALPLGRIRIRERGSSGGHKGMKSIITHLGRQDFPRLRVGIAQRGDREGGLSEKETAVKYVLSNFQAEEKSILRHLYPKVAEAIYCLLTEGIASAMNKYN